MDKIFLIVFTDRTIEWVHWEEGDVIRGGVYGFRKSPSRGAEMPLSGCGFVRQHSENYLPWPFSKFAVPYRISCNTYIYIYWKNTCEPRKEYLIFIYHLDIHYDYFILILLLWWWEKLFKFFIFTGLFITIKYASIARAVRVSVYCRDGRNRGQGGNGGAWHSWGIVSQHWSTGQCKKNQLD